MRTGPRKGELAWTSLRHHHVLPALHNPRLRRGFCFGRRRWRPGRGGKPVTELLPGQQRTVLICDAHRGDIDWGQFEANQAQLATNAQAHGTMGIPASRHDFTVVRAACVVCV